MKKICIALILWNVVLLGPQAFAAAYTLDKAHTSLGFDIKHLMVSTVRGKFTHYEGTIDFDRTNLTETKINVTIQAASIDTNNADRDKHLRTPDFFDVEKYPTITFTSHSIRENGDQYVITGDLTIKGTTRAIEIPVEIAGPIRLHGESIIGITGETKINRQDFGITWNQQMDQGGYVLGDDVTLDIKVEAHIPFLTAKDMQAKDNKDNDVWPSYPTKQETEALIKQVLAVVDLRKADRKKQEAAIPTLIEMLGNESPLAWQMVGGPDYMDTPTSPSREAAQTLAVLGGPAVPALKDALLHHEDYAVRREAADVLTRIGDETAVPALIAALKDDDYQVRDSVLEGIVKFKNVAVVALVREQLHSEDWRIKRGTIEAIKALDAYETAEEIITALDDENRLVKIAAIEALAGWEEPRAIDPLIRVMMEEDITVRMLAATALGKYRAPRVFDALYQVATDRREREEIWDDHYHGTTSSARIDAIHSLAKFDDPRLGKLWEELLNDPDGNVRLAAVEALEHFKEDQSVSLLEKGLKDSYSFARMAAAERLGRIKNDPRVVALLIEALHDKDSRVRLRVAEALQKLNDRSAVPALIDLLSNGEEDWSVSAAAQRALEDITGHQISEWGIMLGGDSKEAARQWREWWESQEDSGDAVNK